MTETENICVSYRESFLSLQNTILAMIAAGEEFSVVIGELIFALGRYRPNVTCSVLALQANGSYLRYISAPQIEPIVENFSPQIIANLFELESRVIVKEIVEKHVADAILEEEMSRIAASPETLLKEICSPNGEFLGFLSLYYGEIRILDPVECEQMDVVLNLLGIALDRELTIQRLIVAKKEALQASCAKSEFLANMSHEIRTPLTGIIGFAESMLNRNISNSDRDSALNSIIRNSDHLLSLLNDILDLSKVDAGKLDITIEQVDPFLLIDDVIALFSGKADEKKLQLSCDVRFPFPRIIISDCMRLKQILVNLVSNAIKFTDYGKVCVHAWYNELSERVYFSVKDTGVGIDDDLQENIFQRFSQGNIIRQKRREGTGLGLSIAKSLAEGLGGGISCSSNLGRGSEFTVWVDFQLTKLECGDVSNLLTLERPCGRSNEPLRFDAPIFSSDILIVEDTVDNQIILSSVLGQAGFNVECVGNGKLAVDCVMRRQYDVILMDMQMPIMDGYEATRMLRGNGCIVPIIGISAIHDSGKLIEAGCNFCVTKPFKRKQLFAAITSVLSEIKYNEDDVSCVRAGDEVDVLAMSDAVDEMSCNERLVVFKESVQQLLDVFGESLQTAEYLRLMDLAHKLAGAAGLYGFAKLGEVAAEVENGIEEQQFHRLPVLFERMKDIFLRSK